ncbi:MAG: outer membrane protein transport protein [Syntrophobacteraceae bacterium]|nr:outer membrane protein transport protein [Syntrophobacteraceae bacterium]
MRARAWLGAWIFGIIGSLLMSAQCFGAGFALWEGSARGIGLGDAVVGRADDPSALFYNPAGITQLPGLQMMVGGTGILTEGEVTANGTRVPYPGEPPFTSGVNGTESTINNWAFVPNFYLTGQCSDRVYLGLGIFSPFGLAVKFPSDWLGAFNSYDAEVQSLTVNPNVAFKINDQLSVAAGLEAMEFGLTLRQRVPFPHTIGTPPFYSYLPAGLSPDLETKGDTWGYGYNLALHYKPCRWVAMGVSYRSQITEGGDLNTNLNFPLAGQYAYTASHTSMTLPDSVATGVVFYPSDRWSWEIGGIWTRWSDFNKLSLIFDQPILGAANNPFSATKDWHDSWRFQTGVEYHVTPCLDLRAGYVYDEEAINSTFADYLLPSNNRHEFSLGAGLHQGPWALDIAYQFILIEDSTIANSTSPGYVNVSQLRNTHANLVSADVTYKFW